MSHINDGHYLEKLKELVKIISEWEKRVSTGDELYVGLYPHVHADADALGSCLAFALLFAKLGIKAKILAEEREPSNIREVLSPMLEKFIIYKDEEFQEFVRNQNYAFRLDSSENSRLGNRLSYFLAAKEKNACLTLDHHLVSASTYVSCPEEDLFFLAHQEAAATCELVAEFISLFSMARAEDFLDEEIARALITGLITDTGRFSYSNVTTNTFLQAAYVMQKEKELAKVSFRLFEEKTESALRLRGLIYQEAERHTDGALLLAKLGAKKYREFAAVNGDLEGLSAELRTVRGVKLAVLFRGLKNGDIKASLRSSTSDYAYQAASLFGGGGHAKASGFLLSKEELFARYSLPKKAEKYYLTTEIFDALSPEGEFLQEFWLEKLKKDFCIKTASLLSKEKIG